MIGHEIDVPNAHFRCFICDSSGCSLVSPAIDLIFMEIYNDFLFPGSRNLFPGNRELETIRDSREIPGTDFPGANPSAETVLLVRTIYLSKKRKNSS